MHAGVDFPFSRPALGSWAILIVAMLAAEEMWREKTAIGKGRSESS
jgi:hypothetical protein